MISSAESTLNIMTHWCNKQTIRNKVKFNKVALQELEVDFFDEYGDTYPEAVIEDTYKSNIFYATDRSVHASKMGGHKRKNKKVINNFRGVTDGKLDFYLDGIIAFTGVQETKKDIKRWSADYTDQLTQLAGYWVQDYLRKTSRVLIANSESMFDVIFIDENEDYLKEIMPNLLNGLKEYSPCELYKSFRLDPSKLIIHTYNVHSKEQLDEILEIIYRRCSYTNNFNF